MCRLDVSELLLLGGTDVVTLPLGLLLQKLVKLASRFASLTVVALLLALATVLFEQAQEVENFRVSGHVDHATRAGITHHLLLLHLLSRHIHVLHASRVFYDFILDLLHQVKELIEADASVAVWVKAVNKVTDLIGIALQRAHNCFEIFHLDMSRPIGVKHLKDAAEVGDLLVREVIQILFLLLGYQILVGVVHLFDGLLAGLGFGAWEWRSLVHHGLVLFGIDSLLVSLALILTISALIRCTVLKLLLLLGLHTM